MIMNGSIMKKPQNHHKSQQQQQQVIVSSSEIIINNDEQEQEELVRQQQSQQQQQQHDNRYTCSICQETYFDQLKFFGHLKAHYEFPVNSIQQQQQQQLPPSNSSSNSNHHHINNSSINLISDYQAAEILIEASTSSSSNIHLQQQQQQQQQQQSPVITATRSINQHYINNQQQQPTHRIVAVETTTSGEHGGGGGAGSIQVFRLEHPGDDEGRIIASGQSSFDGEIELKINPEGDVNDDNNDEEEDIKHSSSRGNHRGHHHHHQGPSLCVVQDIQEEEEGEEDNQTESVQQTRLNNINLSSKPVKILLKCSKCRRTFRREKTYQTHVESCQKPDGEEDTETTSVVKSKTKRTNSKVKVEPVDSNVAVVGTHDEEEVNDEESDGIPLDHEHEGDSNDGHLRMEDDPLCPDEEDFLDDSNVCPICDELYTSRANLEAHVSKAHPDVRIGPRSSSSVPQKNTPKKKKLPSQKKQEVLKCSECSRIFNHRNSLVYHMRSHTGERPHQCDICGKSFFATSALKVHMRLHSGEKPYKCEHCDRNFRQWGDLKYHVISIHSDIRQYQCEYCGKDFARKYSLIVHRRIHTGERNYKCEFCDKAFRAASYLQNHRRIHTGEKPHACSVCGKPFRVRSDMKRHMASHNRDQHGHHGPSTSSMPVAASVSSSGQQSTQGLINGASSAVINVSNANTGELIVGPSISQLVHHSRVQTIEVPVTTSEIIVGQQQITIDDGTDEVISGDITEGTPINITLQDGRLPEGSALSAASVAALQESDIPDGVIYQNRDGQMEVVTIRESTTGTLYVWPVFMN